MTSDISNIFNNQPGGATPPPNRPLGTTPDGTPTVDTTMPAGTQNLTSGARGMSPPPDAGARGVVPAEDEDERRASTLPTRDFAAEHRALDAEERRYNELRKTGFTDLNAHPPLKEGDRIQGPHDRDNRKPTEAELEHGRIHRETESLVFSNEHVPNDPPIHEGAPPDVPADPRKVAESRGIKFTVPDNRRTAIERNTIAEVPEPGEDVLGVNEPDESKNLIGA